MGRNKLPPHPDPKVNHRRQREVDRYKKNKDLKLQELKRKRWREQKKRWKEKKKSQNRDPNCLENLPSCSENLVIHTISGEICTVQI
jgi:hypothetical protein